MKNRNAVTDKALCEHLRTCHRGQKNAASSKELEAAFHVKGSELRRAVNRLRCNGHLICSNESGYFYAIEPSEVKATIAQLSGRIAKISAAKDGLLRSSQGKEG